MDPLRKFVMSVLYSSSLSGVKQPEIPSPQDVNVDGEPSTSQWWQVSLRRVLGHFVAECFKPAVQEICTAKDLLKERKADRRTAMTMILLRDHINYQTFFQGLSKEELCELVELFPVTDACCTYVSTHGVVVPAITTQDSQTVQPSLTDGPTLFIKNITIVDNCLVSCQDATTCVHNVQNNLERLRILFAMYRAYTSALYVAGNPAIETLMTKDSASLWSAMDVKTKDKLLRTVQAHCARPEIIRRYLWIDITTLALPWRQELQKQITAYLQKEGIHQSDYADGLTPEEIKHFVSKLPLYQSHKEDHAFWDGLVTSKAWPCRPIVSQNGLISEYSYVNGVHIQEIDLEKQLQQTLACEQFLQERQSQQPSFLQRTVVPAMTQISTHRVRRGFSKGQEESASKKAIAKDVTCALHYFAESSHSNIMILSEDFVVNGLLYRKGDGFVVDDGGVCTVRKDSRDVVTITDNNEKKALLAAHQEALYRKVKAWNTLPSQAKKEQFTEDLAREINYLRDIGHVEFLALSLALTNEQAHAILRHAHNNQPLVDWKQQEYVCVCSGAQVTRLHVDEKIATQSGLDSVNGVLMMTPPPGLFCYCLERDSSWVSLDKKTHSLLAHRTFILADAQGLPAYIIETQEHDQPCRLQRLSPQEGLALIWREKPHVLGNRAQFESDQQAREAFRQYPTRFRIEGETAPLSTYAAWWNHKIVKDLRRSNDYTFMPIAIDTEIVGHPLLPCGSSGVICNKRGMPIYACITHPEKEDEIIPLTDAEGCELLAVYKQHIDNVKDLLKKPSPVVEDIDRILSYLRYCGPQSLASVFHDMSPQVLRAVQQRAPELFSMQAVHTPILLNITHVPIAKSQEEACKALGIQIKEGHVVALPKGWRVDGSLSIHGMSKPPCLIFDQQYHLVAKISPEMEIYPSLAERLCATLQHHKELRLQVRQELERLEIACTKESSIAFIHHLVSLQDPVFAEEMLTHLGIERLTQVLQYCPRVVMSNLTLNLEKLVPHFFSLHRTHKKTYQTFLPGSYAFNQVNCSQVRCVEKKGKWHVTLPKGWDIVEKIPRLYLLDDQGHIQVEIDKEQATTYAGGSARMSSMCMLHQELKATRELVIRKWEEKSAPEELQELQELIQCSPELFPNLAYMSVTRMPSLYMLRMYRTGVVQLDEENGTHRLSKEELARLDKEMQGWCVVRLTESLKLGKDTIEKGELLIVDSEGVPRIMIDPKHTDAWTVMPVAYACALCKEAAWSTSTAL